MNSAQKNYARMLPNPISAQASNACVEIFSVRAAVLIWLVVLKSTRALGTKVTAGLIEFSLPFSQPAQRSGCDEKYGPRMIFQAACPEPARRGRLWSGPTLFKRAEALCGIDASAGLSESLQR